MAANRQHDTGDSAALRQPLRWRRYIAQPLSLPYAAPSPDTPDAGDLPVVFTFDYRFAGDAAKAVAQSNDLKVFRLSGSDYTQVDQVLDLKCACIRTGRAQSSMPANGQVRTCA